MKEKEFGKLSRQQLREFYAFYHGYNIHRSEFNQAIKEQKNRLSKIIYSAGSWGCLYEFPEDGLAIAFLLATKLFDTFVAVTNEKDPQAALLRFMGEDFEPEGLTEEEEHTAIVIYMAIMGNYDGNVCYGESITEMLARVPGGDDEALFRAVRVDRACLEASPAAERIAVAHLMDDSAFMDKLAKAITKTKPMKPRQDLDDTRFLLKLLDHAKGLKSIDNKTVDQLIADDLQAIPGNNTFDRISKLLTDFRRKSRK